MAGKKGLAAELERVEQAWNDGQFALLHDLTNCLRIGDITVFGNDGSLETIEVKSDPERRSPVQRRKIKAAREAIINGAPLPGTDRRSWLYDLDVPFKTHLDLLEIGTERAAREGIFAARVKGERALLVTDFYGCNAQGWAEDEYLARLQRKFGAARRRAGLGTDQEWSISATSLDSVSRDPQRVPFAAYPLHPAICARLIGDFTVFVVETSGPALADSLHEAGLDAEWVRPPSAGELAPGEVVMELRTKASGPIFGELRAELNRTLQIRRSALDRYLIEMIEQDIWIRGMKYMLANYSLEGQPWSTFRDEDQVWV